jgi:glucose-6-phosphate 1-dehydrogenase
LSFSEAFKGQHIVDAYERLLLEAMRGNSTLFISREEIEQAWTWGDSMQNAWVARLINQRLTQRVHGGLKQPVSY